MQEKRLLERLRAIELDPSWRGESEPQAAIASVLHHLMEILNTRQGSVPIAPDFGIPDFTSIGSTFDSDTLPEIEATLGQVIAKYEPRLVEVKVSHQAKADSPFVIAFKLAASIKVNDKKVPVVFEAVLNADGRIEVLE